LRQGDVLSDTSNGQALLHKRLEGPAVLPAFLFEQFLRRSGSSRIHKTKSMEPLISRNMMHLLSLSARAMETREEIFND
jgi:hypothetical protein